MTNTEELLIEKNGSIILNDKNTKNEKTKNKLLLQKSCSILLNDKNTGEKDNLL